jgi:hypothetical protein
MKNSPFDFLDSSTYNREQLLQIIHLLYNLLQEREVTVTLQPEPTPTTIPFVPQVLFTYPPDTNTPYPLPAGEKQFVQ